MLLEADVDLNQIKFECRNCGKLIEFYEKPRLKVLIDPCKCILEESKFNEV